ncbi:hypothetical protein BC332_28456 [Capsicum chinense]|nr:hypothetical protein BC332_28456 [Capsicum chinense]
MPYALNLLKRFKLDKCKPVATPLVVNEKLMKDDGEERADSKLYRSLIGSLLYLTATRPDVMFATSLLSRYMQCPSTKHLGAAKRVLRYSKGITDYGIWYRSMENGVLIGYSDSDWGACLDDYKSTSGYSFSFGSGIFSWSTKKQDIVAQSSAEAEYVAAASATNQGIWLRKILFELDLLPEEPTVIYVDNKSAIAMAENPVQHGKTKHINFRFLALRDAEKNGEVKLGRATGKRATPGTLSKQQKHDTAKYDKSGKAAGRASGAASGDVGYPSESRTSGNVNVSATVSGNGNLFSTVHKGAASLTRLVDHSNGSNAELTATKFDDLSVSAGNDDVNETSDVQKESSSRLVHSPRQDASKANEKVQKRSIPAEELDRLNKRRKGETDNRDIDYGDARSSERERLMDVRTADKLHPVDYDQHGSDDQILNRASEKPLDRSKDKGGERPERDHRERVDRPDRSRGDDAFEKSRDRSTERHGRERSIERVQERVADRNFDKLSKDERIKDDRTKLRHSEASVEKSHTDDRFHNQNLPPPPPLPPHMVPQSINAGRRDDDSDRRFGTARHSQRLSPRHDERERRRSEENNALLQDDLKRRREEDFRDRKREERELSMKVEEREREREKGSIVKEDMDPNASKRRKLKREHMASEPGEYSPAAHPPAISINMSQPCDGRDRGERKGVIVQQRPGYLDEPGLRIHGKESASKAPRRDADSYPY